MSHSNRSTGGAIMGAIGGFAIMLGISRMLQVGFSDWIHRLFVMRALDGWILFICGWVVPIFIGIWLAKEELSLLLIPFASFILGCIETFIVAWIFVTIHAFYLGNYDVGAILLVGGGFFVYLISILGTATTTFIIDIFVIKK